MAITVNQAMEDLHVFTTTVNENEGITPGERPVEPGISYIEHVIIQDQASDLDDEGVLLANSPMGWELYTFTRFADGYLKDNPDIPMPFINDIEAPGGMLYLIDYIRLDDDAVTRLRAGLVLLAQDSE